MQEGVSSACWCCLYRSCPSGLKRHCAHDCTILACCAFSPTQAALTMSFCCGSCQMLSQLILQHTNLASLSIKGPHCHPV